MKKIYTFMLLTWVACSAFASGCVVDTANTQFFAPSPDSLPCIERNVAYNQVIQISVPTQVNLQDFGAPLPLIMTVDSMVISGVNGLPGGITYDPNPANGVLYGGQKGCALLYRTTSDAAGRYPISFDGTFTVHGMAIPPYFDGDTTINLADLQSLSQGMFNMFVDVIEQGAECRPAVSGIKGFSASLNSMLQVFPNPNNGTFQIHLNTGRNIRGEVAVVNFTGQTVFSQPIDASDWFHTQVDLHNLAKGIYTVLVQTTEGVAAKNISVE